jgi:A/G-specific adenine glycosylase
LADIRYDPYLQELAKVAVQAPEPAALNWAILDLAAAICRIEPRCPECPLREKCFFSASQRSASVHDHRN